MSALSAVAAASLVAASVATYLVARLLGLAWPRVAAARQDAAGLRDPLPAWLRVVWPLSHALAVPLGPWLPVVARARLLRTLRRAELDEAYSPQSFVAAVGLHTVGGAVLAWMPWPLPVVGTLLGTLVACWPLLWLHETARRREWQVLRDLPVYVDMLTLALEAGCALGVALQVATSRTPDSPLRRAFQRVQVDLRAGRSRQDALRALAERLDLAPITALVAALVQADVSGGSLSGVLRSQADQRLNERFARAERLALEAPVKLLAPLILCIFPCTFMVLAFPVALRFIDLP
ncbi:MAG: type II secretion system F family protein [Steroidobacteraceae bacterium]